MSDKPPQKPSNKIIGYGILVFLAGLIGSIWIVHLQWLILPGSAMTFYGIYRFFTKADLRAEFTYNRREDFLTYFWNVLVLKIWTFIMAICMIVIVIDLLNDGRI